MTVTAKCLIESQMVPGSVFTPYTAPTGTRTIIDKFTAYNSDGSTHTLTVYLVPSGDAAGSDNVILNALSITTLATVDSTVMQNQILNAGDTIQCFASTTNVVSIRCSGRECQ